MKEDSYKKKQIKKANFSMEIHMRYNLCRIIGEMDVIERFDSK